MNDDIVYLVLCCARNWMASPLSWMLWLCEFSNCSDAYQDGFIVEVQLFLSYSENMSLMIASKKKPKSRWYTAFDSSCRIKNPFPSNKIAYRFVTYCTMMRKFSFWMCLFDGFHLFFWIRNFQFTGSHSLMMHFYQTHNPMNEMRRSDWTTDVPSVAERLFYTFLLLLSSLNKPSQTSVVAFHKTRLCCFHLERISAQWLVDVS